PAPGAHPKLRHIEESLAMLRKAAQQRFAAIRRVSSLVSSLAAECWPAPPPGEAPATMPQCPAGCDGASAWMAPSGQLLRTAIKDRAIILVAINEFDRAVGLHHESDVAQHGPGGKLALELRINALTVALSMEESADADLGMDLLGGDFHLKLGGVAAITFARDVLRVTSGERKIVSRRSCTCARGQGKSDAADKWMDGSHYDSPTFS